MFYGGVVKPGKPLPVVPHADAYALHLSQAALPAAGVKDRARASLCVSVGGEPPVVLCTLCAGSQDTVLLDQFLDEYAELSVTGPAGVEVHVTGYYSPMFGGDGGDDGDDDDEDEEGGAGGGDALMADGSDDDEFELPALHPLDRVFTLADGSDGEDEEDEEGETDDEDEEDEESDDGLLGRPGSKAPSVIIEDITDNEPAKAQADGKKRKALDAAGGAAAAAAPKKAKEQQQTPAAAAAAAKGKAKQEGAQQQQQQATPQQQGKQQKQQQQQGKQDGKQQQQQDKQAKQKQQQQEAKKPDASPGAARAVPGGKPSVRRFENGFEIHELGMGDPAGKLAKAGKRVAVRYTGRLASNGKVFDKTGAKPFTFRLGVGEVIKGWDRGVEGMRVGDKRKLLIPPQMAYGSQRTGPIPPNSTLDFEVELVDVK